MDNENNNKQYTDVVLPFIIKNYNIGEPKAKFISIIDIIERIENATKYNKELGSQIIYTYYQAHLN